MAPYYPLGPLGEGLAKVRLALEAVSTGPGSVPARKPRHGPLPLARGGGAGSVVTES